MQPPKCREPGFFPATVRRISHFNVNIILGNSMTWAKKTNFSFDSSSPSGKDAKLEVLKLFRVIFKVAQQHANYIEANCGISNAQLWAILKISQNPGMRVSELAQALSIHQTTASNLLDKLSLQGLIKRERISDDQRVVSLFITDVGRQILLKSPQPAQGLLQNALFNLPNSTIVSLESNLNELIKLMGAGSLESAMEPLDLSRNYLDVG